MQAGESIDAAQVDLSPAEREEISGSPLLNEDIAPVPAERRTWTVWNFAALWVGMSVCIPTYMMASGLISRGMNWRQAIFTIFLGNLIVLIPMLLNAHAGAKYGIPFPVFARSAFGTAGAHVPAVLRAIVACGWFGIQTWIGGWAIYKLLTVFFPGWNDLAPLPLIGVNAAHGVCFLVFWGLNVAVVWRGLNAIRRIEDWGAPLLLVLGACMLVWASVKAGGLGPIFSAPSQIAPGDFWNVFIPSLTAMVGFWATLSLNIPDFTRMARSQRDQVAGQALGLNTSMPIYAFIGVAVTSAAFLIFDRDPAVFAGYESYGGTPEEFRRQLWDPVFLLSQFHHPAVVIVSMIALTLATLTTNLAANVVAPANSFSNLSPRRISFRAGGVIAGVVGMAMMPWKLLEDPGRYIDGWLIGYGALLGPIGGILIADYFVVCRRRLSLADLYKEDGRYRYTGGFSGVGLVALVLSVLPNVPGFLVAIGAVGTGAVHPFFTGLYQYAWFGGFALAFVIYVAGRRMTAR